MRTWLAGLCIAASLLALASPARAQGAAFRRVPVEHWAYTAVRKLEQAGYFTGSEAGTFSGRRVLTRYEFAVAVERMYEGLQPRVLAATAAGRLPQELRHFRRLLREFSADMSALGLDVAGMERQLDALAERVARLPRGADALEEEDAPARPILFVRPRTFGLRGVLDRPPVLETLSLSGAAELRAPGRPLGPELTASLGALAAELRLSATSRLDTLEGLPFEDPTDALGYRAQVSLPFGDSRLSAFYDRQGPLADRYRLANPYLDLGPLQGIGGSFTQSFGRLALQVGGARLRAIDDDLARMSYLKGSLDYELGSGFRLGVGLERTWLGGAGGVYDYSAYTAAIARQFGPNARFELLWRYFTPSRLGDAVDRDLGNTSAVGQISVRF